MALFVHKFLLWYDLGLPKYSLDHIDVLCAALSFYWNRVLRGCTVLIIYATFMTMGGSYNVPFCYISSLYRGSGLLIHASGWYFSGAIKLIFTCAAVCVITDWCVCLLHNMFRFRGSSLCCEYRWFSFQFSAIVKICLAKVSRNDRKKGATGRGIQSHPIWRRKIGSVVCRNQILGGRRSPFYERSVWYSWVSVGLTQTQGWSVVVRKELSHASETARKGSGSRAQPIWCLTGPWRAFVLHKVEGADAELGQSVQLCVDWLKAFV